jgi:hypothetical protein
LSSGEDSVLLYCDRCLVAVHPKCYLVNEKELEGETWLCLPCRLFIYLLIYTLCRNGIPIRDELNRPNPERLCKLCGHSGGALYEVKNEKIWAHAACVVPFDGVNFL